MNKLIFFCTYLLTGYVYAQSVLMTINNDTIYKSNFEKNQKKSLELIGTQQTINNFIDFNLLKQYALKNKIDNSPAYLYELVKKGEILKDSLYYPTEIIEPLLQDYFNKIKTEKKVQLLAFKDSDLKGKNEKSKEHFINSVIKKINNDPIKFKEAVQQYSLVPYFGQPSFFDIFSIGKSLVDAIYRAPLNTVTLYKDINDLYYLILVSEERKYLGEVVLDQIFINDISEVGKTEIKNIYKKLQEGEDFIEIKQKYSQKDNFKVSSFYTDISNQEVYNYTLKEINSETSNHKISEPIKLNNGYAIYKYYFRDSYDTYLIARKKIYNRLKKSEEINELNTILINELKNYTFFKENTQTINQFIELLPVAYNKFEKLELSEDNILVNIGDTFILTNKALLIQLKEELNSDNYVYRGNIIDNIIYEWKNGALLEYYKTHFYEVDRIKDSWENMKDQLLIKYSFILIAHNAQKDIEGQKNFLQIQAPKLTWDERIQGSFYYCLNSDVEKEVLQMLKDKKSVEHIKNYFKGKTDSEKNELLIINQGKLTRESLNLPKDEKLIKKVYVVNNKSRRLIIDIKKIIKNDTMTLEELQSNYMNEYVDYKTTQIINQLKEKADITINKDQENFLIEKYH